MVERHLRGPTLDDYGRLFRRWLDDVTRVRIGPELNEENKSALREHMVKVLEVLSDEEFDTFVEAIGNPPSNPEEVKAAYTLPETSLGKFVLEQE
jgi:hypothetical protein